MFSGDGGYATHELAQFAKRHHRQLTLVSRFYANSNLYAGLPQPTGKKNGRPRKKGHKLPTPEEFVQQSGKRRKLTVAWYGGGQRKVEVISGTGHWYEAGVSLLEIRTPELMKILITSGTHAKAVIPELTKIANYFEKDEKDLPPHLMRKKA